MHRIIPGEVFEIQTPKGLAYFQNIGKDPMMGNLIRILDGFFMARPNDFEELVAKPERFTVYFPLGPALNRKLVTFASKATLPQGQSMSPPMKQPGMITREGKIINWRIFENGNEFIREKLTNLEVKYSPREVWNDTLLIERVSDGWRPEQDY